MTSVLQTKPLGFADTGRCPCCGHVSRKVWGLIHRDGKHHATYFVHWTVGHVVDYGAHIDLIMGRWGDGTSTADRYPVSLEHCIFDNGPGVMVIDASTRDVAANPVIGAALNRTDMIGSPIEPAAFAIYDEIIQHDPRLAALWERSSGD